MGNSEEKKADRLLDQVLGQTPDPSLDKLLDEGIVNDETHGNRVEEKIENRAGKKQQTHEEAKSITGAEPHKDVTNEHPGEGPAPLDRY
jgi:rubrerythrin